jgi:hypothetical protein
MSFPEEDPMIQTDPTRQQAAVDEYFKTQMKRERRDPRDTNFSWWMGMALGMALALCGTLTLGTAFGGRTPWYIGKVATLLVSFWTIGCAWAITISLLKRRGR